MQREDKAAKEVENREHRVKFDQKNEQLPELPTLFSDMTLDKGPLRYVAVESLPKPSIPTSDNFQRFTLSSVNLKLPKVINLAKVTILWSQEMESKEHEKLKADAEAQRREQKRM